MVQGMSNELVKMYTEAPLSLDTPATNQRVDDVYLARSANLRGPHYWWYRLLIK